MNIEVHLLIICMLWICHIHGRWNIVKNYNELFTEGSIPCTGFIQVNAF